MPKPVLPTPEIDDESAGTARPPISTDTEAERQPSTIDAADETLNDIDQDLAELEALFSRPEVSPPEAPDRKPAASPGAPSPTEVTEAPPVTTPIDHPRKEKSAARGTDGSTGAAEAEDETFDADPASWNDANTSNADRVPSESPGSAIPPSLPEDEDWEIPGRFARSRQALRLVCRAGAPHLAYVLEVLDRPFRRVSIRVKTLLGYVACATLVMSLGVWIYALWTA